MSQLGSKAKLKNLYFKIVLLKGHFIRGLFYLGNRLLPLSTAHRKN